MRDYATNYQSCKQENTWLKKKVNDLHQDKVHLKRTETKLHLTLERTWCKGFTSRLHNAVMSSGRIILGYWLVRSTDYYVIGAHGFPKCKWWEPLGFQIYQQIDCISKGQFEHLQASISSCGCARWEKRTELQ